jgi:hypothetical protein
MKNKALNFDQKILEQQQGINMVYPPGNNNNQIRELCNNVIQNSLVLNNLRPNLSRVSS